MRRKLTYTLLAVLGFISLKAQDSIVFYSGFEENIQPVYTTNHISELNTTWFSAWNSPDIFSYSTDTSSSPNICGIPINSAGHQYSLLGQAYGGFLAIAIGGWGDDLREWFGSKLMDSLTEGETYCIKLNISLGDTCQYASNNIGVYFSPDSIYMSNEFPTPPTPYPINYDYVVTTPTNVLFDNKEIWTKIELQYTAKGDEKFLYLGNFYPDSLTSFQFIGNGSPSFGAAYYYVDEVSIYKCEPLGINENGAEKIKVYPNPAQDCVTLTIPQNFTNAQLSIYNLTGQLLMQKQIAQPNQQIPITELSNGMYIFVVQNGERVIGRQRMVVNRH